MSERPATLPELDAKRLREIHDLLRHESSISFYSARAHESIWMLYMAASEPYRSGAVPLDQPLPRTPLQPLDPAVQP